MGIFSNADSVLTNIGSNLLGGVVGKVTDNITKDAEEEEWYNRTGIQNS